MKNRWLMGAAAAALTVAGAFSAQAADLPTRKEAPAPVFVPPPFTWTGFYVGLNAGGIWGQGNLQTTLYNPGFLPLTTYWPGGSLGGGQSGFLGGAQAGYNWQSGAFVLGLETDLDWTSMNRNSSFVGANFLDPLGSGRNDFLTENGSRKLDWIGTTRARVGFVATPDNRLMFYGTGGFAYGGASSHLNVFDSFNGWDWYGNHNNTRTGWTLGAGVEYAITNNITIKGEYLYYNLGSSHTAVIENPAASLIFPNTVATAKVNFDGSILRAGVNYKF
jgi:outer membrane immunogenic protein